MHIEKKSFETIVLKRKRGPLFQYNLKIKRVLRMLTTGETSAGHDLFCRNLILKGPDPHTYL